MSRDDHQLRLDQGRFRYWSHRALDYIEHGCRALERAREPGSDHEALMREARNCAHLAGLCNSLARGEPA